MILVAATESRGQPELKTRCSEHTIAGCYVKKAMTRLDFQLSSQAPQGLSRNRLSRRLAGRRGYVVVSTKEHDSKRLLLVNWQELVGKLDGSYCYCYWITAKIVQCAQSGSSVVVKHPGSEGIDAILLFETAASKCSQNARCISAA